MVSSLVCASTSAGVTRATASSSTGPRVASRAMRSPLRCRNRGQVDIEAPILSADRRCVKHRPAGGGRSAAPEAPPAPGRVGSAEEIAQDQAEIGEGGGCEGLAWAGNADVAIAGLAGVSMDLEPARVEVDQPGLGYTRPGVERKLRPPIVGERTVRD